MVAFGEQVKVHVAQLRAKAVRVFGNLLATGPADLQQVRLCLIQVRGEQPRQAALHHFGQHSPVLPGEYPCIQGTGQKGTHPAATRTIAMGAQYCERIGVLGAGKGIELPLPKATVVTRSCIHL
ncbi:hypothetical protein D3C76_1584760 [compost metagenome]